MFEPASLSDPALFLSMPPAPDTAPLNTRSPFPATVSVFAPRPIAATTLLTRPSDVTVIGAPSVSGMLQFGVPLEPEPALVKVTGPVSVMALPVKL